MTNLPPSDRDAEETAAQPELPQSDPPEAPARYDTLFSEEDVRRAEGETEIPQNPLAEQAEDMPALADEHEDAPASGGPSLPVILGALALLVALGVGTAFGYTSWRNNQQAAADAAAAATAAAAVPTPDPFADPAAQANLPQASTQIADDETIVRVGDVNITHSDFKRSYRPGDNPDEVVNQLIQIELVAQAARDEGVEIDETLIDQTIEQIKAQQAITDTVQFESFLQQNGIDSEAQLRELLARDQLINAMMLAHTEVEQVRARHILLQASTEEEIANREDEAQALLAELEDGADFATLAEERSEDPGSAVNGGDLGWAPRGVFVPEFDEAIFEMERDELRLVQSQFGWHIIQVMEEAEVRTLENQDFLQTMAGQEAFNSTFLPWVEQLTSDAEADNRVERVVETAALVEQP